MKVTAGLRGVRLDKAHLGPQGIKYDRNFMLFGVGAEGELKKLQLSTHPQCSLFPQDMVCDAIHVRYEAPKEPLVPHKPEQDTVLEVPLEPDTKHLELIDVNLHQSMVSAYRMGAKYDEWFSACFGFDTILVYIGGQRRPILGTFSPRPPPSRPQKSWFSSVNSFLTGNRGSSDEPDWLTFSDVSPYLIATEASVDNVRSRLASGDVDIVKFRPNIVLDGEEAFDEDFWAELSLRGQPTFTLTKMCCRCTSVNVDYATGRTAEDERGTVLKKLSVDRRVDVGAKYSAVFGRYGSLTDLQQLYCAQGLDLVVSVGDDMAVTRRNEERPEWDWPIKDPKVARFYYQRS